MFYRAAVERQGKGKNNETSEDKTKLPSTSSPLPCSFIPNRAWRSRTVIHRVRHTILMALLLFSLVLHHHLTRQSPQLLRFQFDSFCFYYVFKYYYLSYNCWFSCMCFLRNCASLRVIFIFLRSDFSPIRDCCF